MGDSLADDDLPLLELDPRTDPFEEPSSGAEYQRDDVEVELADQPGREILVDDVGAGDARD